MNMELLEALATRAGWSILHTLWQGAALGIVVALVLPLVRGAAARHTIGMLALVGMGALLVTNIVTHPTAPATTATGPAAPVIAATTVPTRPLADPVPAMTAADSPAAVTIPSQGPVSSSASVPPSIAPPAASMADQLQPVLPWIAGLWFLGVFLLSLRQLGAWWCVSRWRKNATAPAPDAIHDLAARVRARLRVLGNVPVFGSERVAAPLLVGVIKPVVLLPLALVNGLKQDEIEAILAHEFAHFRRRDGWANFIQIGIETLLFYHPVVWWLGRLTRREREHATDDLALRCGTGREVYAAALAAVAEFQVAGPALAASGGPLLSRIRRILSPAPRKRGSPALAGLAGGIALASVIAAVTIGQLSTGTAREEKPEARHHQAGSRVEVAPGASIQTAIDDAKEGTTIVLAKGTYPDPPLRIDKALTLEGAGWDQTILQPAEEAGAKPTPTITITGTKDVVIRGLRVLRSTKARKTATAVAARGRTSRDPIIAIQASEVSIEATAIVGPSGNGITIAGASKVRMSKSLVAAIWGTGVRVEGGPDHASASQLHMNDCAVRNCHHRGVTIGANSNDTVIERSWISGSAWHGIRYDSASPRIERNVIFANARSGIYASGKTAAAVTRNAFIDNEMGGISCWFENADTITGNIFAHNKREGISVLGASTPRISGNWFIGEQIAITCGMIGAEGATAQTTGNPVLKNNRFSTTKTPLMVDGQSAAPPATNLVIDNPPPKEFEPWLYGPIEDKKAAVGHLLPGGILNLMQSPDWPEPLAEERNIIPTGKTRDSRSWNTTGKSLAEIEKAGPTKQERHQMLAAARQAVQPWIDDAFQLDDVGKREAVVGKVRTFLKSTDPDELREGLVAFTSLGPIRFDKASFHDLFVPLLKLEDPSLRILACQSLVMSGVQDGDIDRLVAMTEDPDREVRESAGGQLVRALEKDLTGPAGGAILKLLNEDDVQLRKNIIRTLWGVRFSPAIEARIIELSRDPHDGTDVLYFALSTQPNKSEASVKRIIEFLAHKDTYNVGGRAAWGLGQGVAREQQALVAEAALKVVAARSDGYLFRETMKRLSQYATPAQVDGINALLAKPGVDGEFRKSLEEILGNVTSQ